MTSWWEGKTLERRVLRSAWIAEAGLQRFTAGSVLTLIALRNSRTSGIGHRPRMRRWPWKGNEMLRNGCAKRTTSRVVCSSDTTRQSAFELDVLVRIDFIKCPRRLLANTQLDLSPTSHLAPAASRYYKSQTHNTQPQKKAAA